MTTATRRATPAGSQVWSLRLAEAIKAGPEALIAFAQELSVHQAAKAWEEFGNYTLYRHHFTGKTMGVLKGSEPREVFHAYGRPYWSCSSRFGQTVIGATNQRLWMLRSDATWGERAELAYVIPKHAYIMRMLMEIERGLRDPETGERYGRR